MRWFCEQAPWHMRCTRREAMKPINRKRLHLGIETICTLERADLARVIGGADMGDGAGGGQGQAAVTSVLTCAQSCSMAFGACCNPN
jgi:hypothetical protein